jgi:hypothetical protein
VYWDRSRSTALQERRRVDETEALATTLHALCLKQYYSMTAGINYKDTAEPIAKDHIKKYIHYL